MGAIVRNGEIYGSNMAINDAQVSANTTWSSEKIDNTKADNSVIAPVESNATASRAYAAGAHFIRDSAFCTAKTAIAQGEAFTLNTNYTAGTIGQELSKIGEWVEGTYPSDRTSRNLNTSGGALVAQITLTKGTWLISCGGYISGLTQNSVTRYGITNSESSSITQIAGIGMATAAITSTNNTTNYSIAFPSIPMVVSGNSQNFYFKIHNGDGGYNSGGCSFKAVRIA